MVHRAATNASGSFSAWSHPASKLPYNKLMHWLYGAPSLIFRSLDTFSVQQVLFVPSTLQQQTTLSSQSLPAFLAMWPLPSLMPSMKNLPHIKSFSSFKSDLSLMSRPIFKGLMKLCQTHQDNLPSLKSTNLWPQLYLQNLFTAIPRLVIDWMTEKHVTSRGQEPWRLS